MFRVTDSRIAFPLAEAWEATGDRRYRDSALESLGYVASLQAPNGWWPECDNSVNRVHEPNTHTLAYTVEGLLFGGALLEEQRFVDSARKSADAMLRRFEIDGKLYGRYDKEWRRTVDSICLTGCAQMSQNWSKLYQLTDRATYLNAALQMNDYLCSKQDTSADQNVHGAIAGSDPIGGDYQAYTFPSWATKYFCDALILEGRVLSALEREPRHALA